MSNRSLQECQINLGLILQNIPVGLCCLLLALGVRPMNHHVFRLAEFEVDAGKALEALQCLVQTMLFVRCLGDHFEPHYQECTTFPLTYASCDSNLLNLQIDTEVGIFLTSLRRISPEERKGTLRVCFSTQGYRTASGTQSTKQSIFEEWQITVIVSDATPPASTEQVYAEARKRQDRETMNAVRERVMFIIKEAAASETKLPDRSAAAAAAAAVAPTGGGGGSGSSRSGGKAKTVVEAFPYDLSLLYAGKIQKKKASNGFLSSAKSFASSWFG